MRATYWRSVLAVAQSRTGYLAFCFAVPLVIWLVLQTVPPKPEFYAPTGEAALADLPVASATVCAAVFALLLWPPLLVKFARRTRLPPFFGGMAIGALASSLAIALSAAVFLAFDVSSRPSTGWEIVLGPIWLLSLGFAPQTWAAIAISSLIGGFCAAWSEAVG